MNFALPADSRIRPAVVDAFTEEGSPGPGDDDDDDEDDGKGGGGGGGNIDPDDDEGFDDDEDDDDDEEPLQVGPRFRDAGQGRVDAWVSSTAPMAPSQPAPRRSIVW